MISLAGCLLIDTQGRVLLIHRNTPNRVQWELPGGKIDEGEDAAAAAVREVKEELGIQVEIVRELGRQTFTEDTYRMHYQWFLANIIAGEPQLMEDQYDQLKYFTWRELGRRDDLSPNTRNLVAAQLRGVDLSQRSKDRRIRNEQLVKAENGHVKSMATKILDTSAKALLPLNFACECSDPACSQFLELSADEYAVAHQYLDHFVVKSGHEQLDIERVVSAHPEPANPAYYVIEKYLIGLSVSAP